MGLANEQPDTIAALATAPGRAALAVIRISGSEVLRALEALGIRPGPARRARLRNIKDGAGVLLDRGLVIWFPGPASYTGEDCAELHIHGGKYITEAVLVALSRAGVRPAAPGEFTRRAFENGRMDLGQAEAVADLIDAETEAQARQAIQQLRGALSVRYEAWRDKLIDILARLEALVDFPEEDTGGAMEGVAAVLGELEADFALAVADGARGRQVREGYRVAIVGPPNAGKSTLFNALIGRDAAIVADLPGTTRDVIESPLQLSGYQLVIADTAGLRVADHVIEREGVRRALDWAREADRRIWVFDGAAKSEAWRSGLESWQAGDLCVLNKSDLGEGPVSNLVRATAERRGLAVLSLSSFDEGPSRVRGWLGQEVVAAMGARDFPAVTRLRHASALRDALSGVRRGASRLSAPELAAEDIRLAVRALSTVTGSISTEDVLAKVFATFCIGK